MTACFVCHLRASSTEWTWVVDLVPANYYLVYFFLREHRRTARLTLKIEERLAES